MKVNLSIMQYILCHLLIVEYHYLPLIRTHQLNYLGLFDLYYILDWGGRPNRVEV
jgi:hypothetical protein